MNQPYQDSDEEPGNGSCAKLHVHHSKLLADHSKRLASIEREGSMSSKAIEGKLDLVVKGVGDLSESYGNLMAKVTTIDTSVSGLIGTYKSLFDKIAEFDSSLVAHKKMCDSRHEDIDVKMADLVEDEFDIDTSIISAMTGKEVKTVLTQERKARNELEKKVDSLLVERQIHEREKKAVAEAKQHWSDEIEKTKAETEKTKTARYGMYGGIFVAIVTTVGTIVVAALKLL
ncbi:MAG: hypothetical protein WC565_04170 [Parcubacteria group bacterium]